MAYILDDFRLGLSNWIFDERNLPPVCFVCCKAGGGSGKISKGIVLDDRPVPLFSALTAKSLARACVHARIAPENLKKPRACVCVQPRNEALETDTCKSLVCAIARRLLNF